jgi:CheY-like chemotaxis protein
MGQSQPIGKGARVLVVEDEVLIGEMVAEELEDQGFEVVMETNAEDALKHIEAGEQVDALFTDVHLPGGMDGSELAHRVRKLRPDMPIVYSSGRWHPTEQQRLVSRAVFLAKPYDPRDAGTLLSRLVAAH